MSALGGLFDLGGQGLQAGVGVYESREARKFARKMRETAYQTTVKDMRLAGLNPILAARIGPTQMPGVPASPVIPSFSGTSGAVAGARAGLAGEQSRTEGSRRGEIRARTGVLRQQEAESAARTDAAIAQAGATRAHEERVRADLPRLQAEAAYYGSTAGKAATIGRMGSQDAQTITNFFNPLRFLNPWSRRSGARMAPPNDGRSTRRRWELYDDLQREQYPPIPGPYPLGGR